MKITLSLHTLHGLFTVCSLQSVWSVFFNRKYVSVTSASAHVFACFRVFTAFSLVVVPEPTGRVF